MSANQYPELKTRLAEAVKNKDPVSIEEALTEINRKVPPGKVTPQDKQIQENARVVLENLDSKQRTLSSI